MKVILLIVIYILAVNVLGFALMGIDKYKAKKRGFRIPEATLFVIALIGGAVGSIVGMFTFNHKTRKRYFVFGMPAILIIHIALVIALILSPIRIAIL